MVPLAPTPYITFVFNAGWQANANLLFYPDLGPTTVEFILFFLLIYFSLSFCVFCVHDLRPIQLQCVIFNIYSLSLSLSCAHTIISNSVFCYLFSSYTVSDWNSNLAHVSNTLISLSSAKPLSIFIYCNFQKMRLAFVLFQYTFLRVDVRTLISPSLTSSCSASCQISTHLKSTC